MVPRSRIPRSTSHFSYAERLLDTSASVVTQGTRHHAGRSGNKHMVAEDGRSLRKGGRGPPRMAQQTPTPSWSPEPLAARSPGPRGEPRGQVYSTAEWEGRPQSPLPVLRSRQFINFSSSPLLGFTAVEPAHCGYSCVPSGEQNKNDKQL